MTSYPIIANCNFETRDDAEGKAIHEARKAVESGLTDDADLLSALDALEAVLTEHADNGSVSSVALCDDAEQAVVAAWTADVQAACDRTRSERYVW